MLKRRFSLKTIERRISKLESLMSTLDGKTTRIKKPKPQIVQDNKPVDLSKLPTTRGFGGRRILKDGEYGNVRVFFGKVYHKPNFSDAEQAAYLRAVRDKMVKVFGRFRDGDEIDYVEVDNSHLQRKKEGS